MVVSADSRNGNGRDPTELILIGDNVEDSSAPTREQIMAVYEQEKLRFNAFHRQCDEMYKYYYVRNHVPTDPQNERVPVNPATIRSIIDDLTAHVDINNIDVDVPDTPRTKSRAEKLKKFYLGSWLHVPSSTRRQAVEFAAAYGIGFWKFMFASEQWPDAPKMEEFGVEGTGGNIILMDEEGYKEAMEDWEDRRDISFPMKVIAISPRNLLWDTSVSGMQWTIEFYERPTQEVRKRYPQFHPHHNTDTVEWMEYWDDTYVVYLAGGEIVYGPVKHGYGFNPYVPVDPANTLGWSDGPPQDRWQGIAQPILNLHDAMARHATMYEAILERFAYPSYMFKGGPAAQAAMEDFQPSKYMNHIPPGVEVEAVPGMQPPSDLLSFSGYLSSQIEEATFPSVVRGQRPTGVSAGFPISVLAGLARLKFQPIADATANAMVEGNQRFAKLVENKIRDRITVRARTEVHEFDQSVEPKDIRGYYENSVRLKAEAPEEREREALLALRLYQGLPDFPAVEALKRAGIPNPLEAMMQRRGEDVARMLMPQQAEQALQALGQSFQQQQQQAAGPIPGMNGNTGNQFMPGQSQLQRPGERNIQQGRSATQAGRPSVFPDNMGGVDILGRLLGTAPGGAQGMPSGQTVRS